MKIFQSFRAVQKVTFFFKIGLFGQPHPCLKRASNHMDAPVKPEHDIVFIILNCCKSVITGWEKCPPFLLNCQRWYFPSMTLISGIANQRACQSGGAVEVSIKNTDTPGIVYFYHSLLIWKNSGTCFIDQIEFMAGNIQFFFYFCYFTPIDKR
jgi:hypothetical protein